MLVVHHRVNAVTHGEGEEGHAEILEGHPVEFLRTRRIVVAFILEPRSRYHAEDFVLEIQFDVGDFGDFPKLDAQPDEAADFDDRVRLVVQNVEEHHAGLEHVEEHRTHGEAFKR